MGQPKNFWVHLKLFGEYIQEKFFVKMRLKPRKPKQKSKEVQFLRNRPDACIRMHPNTSHQLWTDLNGSEHVQKLQKTCENVEKKCESFVQILQIKKRFLEVWKTIKISKI